MDLIHFSHCVYLCDYHIVLVTKYRKAVFNPGIFAYFTRILTDITDHMPYIRFKVVNHDKDHVHLLVSIPPTVSVGKAIGIIKQNTARVLKQKFPVFKQIYWGTDALWSESYFVSTVGITDTIIQAYIKQQGKTDAGQTKFVIP